MKPHVQKTSGSVSLKEQIDNGKVPSDHTYPWKTQYNAYRYPKSCEKRTNLPSETVPNLTLSLDEIVARYSQGMPLVSGGGVKVPMYEGDADYFPDVNIMDVVDRTRIIENYKQELQEIEARKLERQKRQAEISAKQAEQRAQQAVDKYMSQQREINSIAAKAKGEA